MKDFSVLGVVRPNFLVLTPICLSLGVAASVLSGLPINWGLLGVVVVGALLAHISVNSLNEYADFRSGLDSNTIRTPFSGGSGTLPEQPHLAPKALLIGTVALTGTILCGIYVTWQAGWILLPVGLLGLLLIVFYTDWINRNRYLVLIAPGLAFGPLMVLGTEYALTSAVSPVGFFASMVPFFLVNNLLLLNQIPDIEADQKAGRDNFAISLSADQCALVYGGFAVAAYLSVIGAALAGLYPITALLGILTAILAYRVFREARSYNGNIASIVPSLAKNVMVTLATPLLVTIGILFGA